MHLGPPRQLSTLSRAWFGHGADGHGHGQVAHSLSAAANADHTDDDHGADIHDVSIIEWIAWTPFLLAIVVFGVFPNLMFKVFDPAVTQLVDHLGAGIPK